MKKSSGKKILRSGQHQDKQPGKESRMKPVPKFYSEDYQPSGKLENKVALITGGDSGIGRAVAVHFAAEGANVAIVYLNESEDAEFTRQFIYDHFQKECLIIKSDLRKEKFCEKIIKEIFDEYKRIDILVNNAAVQFPQESIDNISSDQLENTFRTNVFSMFYLTKAFLKQVKKNSTIINTASVTAYRGSAHLIDYSSAKGAIVSFTRSLAANLAEKKIRVNAVAPGPIWTPLIPSSFKKKDVKTFGSDVPLKRAGEPFEVAPSYVFLASDDSEYMTGQVLHPNGGEIVNG